MIGIFLVEYSLGLFRIGCVHVLIAVASGIEDLNDMFVKENRFRYRFHCMQVGLRILWHEY